MKVRTVWTSVLAVTLLTACASGSGRTGGSIQGSVITASDLQGTPWNTAYEVLNHNRLLTIGQQDVLLAATRGESSLGAAGGGQGMLLVLDGSQTSTGVVDILRSLDAGDIRRIQILRPSEAASRYGTNAQNGVLIIQTKSGG